MKRSLADSLTAGECGQVSPPDSKYCGEGAIDYRLALWS